MKGTSVRYAPMLLAFAVFLGSLGYSLTATRSGHQTLDQISDERIFWSAAQAEIEYLRFLNTLERFGHAEPKVTPQEVMDRYEILWSRIHLFQEGDIGARLSSFHEVTEKTRQLNRLLATQEQAVLSLKTGARAKAAEIAAAFLPYSRTLRQISIAVAADEELRFSGLRNELRNQDWHILAFTLGLLITGGMLVYLLDRERRITASLAARNAALAREATQSNRAKSDFLAMMSHELRTPINGVLGMINLMLGSDLTPKQRDYAERANRAGSALIRIINDILDLTQMELGRLNLAQETFRVRDITRCVTDLFASAGKEKGVTISTTLTDDIPARIEGDSKRVQQVLFKLVGNALKFTPSGEIRIDIRRIPCREPGLRLRFEITDTGIGIHKDKQKQLFEGLSQRHSTHTLQDQGAGLGLAISKQLVTLMAGEIGVVSDPGKGSTFWFELPFGLSLPKTIPDDHERVPPEPARPDSVQPESAQPDSTLLEPDTHIGQDDTPLATLEPKAARQRLHVLIVEELATDREILKAYLERSDFDVSFADTIAEGLATEGQEPYDAVLVNLPSRTVRTLIARNRNTPVQLSDADVPIIGMLDSSDQKLLQACGSSGLSACLVKPLNPKIVTRTVTDCVTKHQDLSRIEVSRSLMMTGR